MTVYEVSIFNDSSWGGWITVGEYTSKEEALSIKGEYENQGYETSLWELDRKTLKARGYL